MKKLICLLILAIVISGCVTGEAGRYYLKEKFEAKEIDEVEILHGEPQRPYVIMAEFQASYASYKHMRKRAAEIGADAVIIKGLGGNYAFNEIWAGNDKYKNTYTRMVGIAIKYKTE